MEGWVVNKILTLGYSSCKDAFHIWSLAGKYNAVVFDLRLYPFSKSEYMNKFSQVNLKNVLQARYIWIGDELGNLNYKEKNGKFKFNDLETGLELIGAVLSERNVILLCCEKSPAKCHRLYVARKLRELTGCEIIHLIKDYRR
jgi:uncharacterized protein (DUF488 family)